MADDGDVILAAGGVVWRRVGGKGGKGDEGEADGGLEVLLVHRPTYDDWSFPKGKRDGDEADEATALREVFEETGVTARLGPELPAVEYEAGGWGRPKRVRYWAMTVESVAPRAPDHEVDVTRWVPVGEAETLLTYERDHAVLRSLLDVLDRR
ncbi:MAG TPA: NUDIX hydrolase [Acidimicrobiales bacterium]